MNRSLLIAGMLLVAHVGLAAQTNAPAQLTPPALAPISFALLRVVASLAFVLALFFGIVWVFKRWRSFGFGRSGDPKLSIVEACSLGNRQCLYLVACEKQKFLVSSSASGVQLISQLPASEPEAEAEVESAPVEVDTFATSLRRALGGA